MIEKERQNEGEKEFKKGREEEVGEGRTTERKGTEHGKEDGSEGEKGMNE